MKRVITGIALAAMTAFAAHPQTINKDGFVGVNKTQSAQSLGHSKLVFVALADATFGTDLFPAQPGAFDRPADYALSNENGGAAPVADFIGVSANVGFAIGIWHYFDIGVNIPIYYDKFVDVAETDRPGGSISPRQVGYIGNLEGNVKARFPLPEDQPFDIAVFAGLNAGTADAKKQGVWIREPEYINKVSGDARPFGTKNTTLKGGLAVTMDLEKIDKFPVLLHLNGGYRYTLNSEYASLPFMSAALDLYFLDFLSLFVEYYWDIDIDGYKTLGIDDLGQAAMVTEKLDMKQLTGALVFHLPIGLDIHVGASYYLGGDNFVHNKKVLQSKEMAPAGTDAVTGAQLYKPNETTVVKTRVNPEYTVYGGLTWSGFLVAQDRDGDGVVDDEDQCPDDYGHRLNRGCPLGNPDADEDGVCDAWVAEKGFEGEFADICEGIDQCPNEAGEGADGCPLDDPDPDQDGVCDAWVSQKKLLKKFKDICDGIDECPAQPGDIAFGGCPTKLPDPDKDGICSPWVTDEGVLEKFADQCKGYDMCPGEAGSKANKGCPWDDPDVDGDGMCDAWVTEKKMGYYFEKAAENEELKKEYFIEKTCKGLDKCPAEFGPANNDGCPLGEPDTDKDGMCDAWVTEKGLLEQYDGICKGIDKCPTESGPEFAQGCPMDDPDTDKDGVCDEWVTAKKMLAQFKDICSGRDKCPLDSGALVNDGCPLDDPDPDKDGVCAAWVTEKKMQEQFKDICTGLDKCPYDGTPEGGLVDKSGCPLENPDPDNDGVCDAWVKQKGLQDLFAGKCALAADGTVEMDKCPLEYGDPKFGGCAAPKIEKLEGVTFQSGKATLQNNAKKVLKSMAKKLTDDPVYADLNIVIQGHTDNRGKAAKNQKLSEDRAKSVMNELIKGGVSKDRIKAIGCGQEAPVADNKTADGREENRRIEMHFVTPDNNGEKCEALFIEE